MMTAEIISLTTLALAALAAIGGYVRFVLVRANVGAQFDIEFTPLGLVNRQPAGDMALVITNLGSNLLVVTRVRYRVRYATGAGDGTPAPKDEPRMSAFLGDRGPKGTFIDLFGGSTPRKKALRPKNDEPRKEDSPKPVIAVRSVISQGGTQAYRKPLTFPGGSGAVTIWASCDYHVNIGPVERFLVRVVLHTPTDDLDFTHGVYNHQVRRTFRLDTNV
jgi:hypothetical protein